MKSVRDADVKEKRVLLRVDFNVPMEDRKIVDNHRIQKSLTTIKYLLEQKAKVIIATHIGRPDGTVIPSLSTVPIAEELAKLLKHKVYATDHVVHPIVVDQIEKMKPGDILVIGNLRWHREEEQNLEVFGEELASYADIYVNDAFSVSHRAHASVEAVTHYLPSYAGFLLESEITTLKLLLENPAQPYVLVLGGAKIADKAKLIENLAPKADTILIGGAVANTFLKASGQDIGQSLHENKMYEVCEEMLKKNTNKLKIPSDSIKDDMGGGEFMIMDIGPKTVEEYTKIISGAKTVFWNGNMGYSEDPRFAVGTDAIAKALASNDNTTVIAGGDTVGYIETHNLTAGINFISTGGGATMQFLAGEKMPGIEALNNQPKNIQ
jgi:phosphoglycerate kinase